MALRAPAAGAQGVGFLTEQEWMASCCAGVSEPRLRDMSAFLKSQGDRPGQRRLADRRDPRKPAAELLVCRESQGCLIEARFGLLDP